MFEESGLDMFADLSRNCCGSEVGSVIIVLDKVDDVGCVEHSSETRLS